MDITLVAPEAIKIKGKTISFLVEPRDTKGKLAADAVITFDKSFIETTHIDGTRVIIAGPGDYEVGGVKVLGVKSLVTSLYYVALDNVAVLVAKASALRSKEVIKDADVVILFADTPVDTSLLATLNPRVVLFYGPQSQENIKLLGKEATPTTKYTTTKDKLPSEMEAVVLA